MKILFNKKGLTLIEIIVTLAVLGIVIAPLMSMFVTSQKINVESRKEYEALQFAQKYMEEIKAMDPTLDISFFSSYDYEDTSDGGKLTGYTHRDGYDLTAVIEGAFDEEAGSGPSAPDFDFTESIDSHYTLNVLTPLGYENIRIVLEEDNLNINVINKVEGHTVNLYIYSIEGENYTAKVNASEGSVRVYKNEATERQPDNQLYNIEITVSRNSEKINTIYGTTIFKYKPVKP
ncbi:MAG TPA: type II secretion system protein [Sedimentibacter sp.]|jgi:prepilin-type N-terminal cleavage/methylation domain-containing protein|nr:type II secretion system protein [Sedimentibacter sp.]